MLTDRKDDMIIFAHSKVIRPTIATVNPELYSATELETLARAHGITGSLDTPCISSFNGDWNTTPIWIRGVTRQNNIILVNLESALGANIPMRVNSLIGFAQ